MKLKEMIIVDLLITGDSSFPFPDNKNCHSDSDFTEEESLLIVNEILRSSE